MKRSAPPSPASTDESRLGRGGGRVAAGRGDPSKSTRLLFSLDAPDRGDSLKKFLSIFSSRGVNLSHIESHSSARRPGYEFMVECEQESGNFGAVLNELKNKTGYLNIISRNYKDSESAMPWFPCRIRDLDRFANQIVSYGPELGPNRAGFDDPEYCSRRKYLGDIAYNYRHGQPIPRVEYTKDEIKTWGILFKHLTELHPTHACKEHNYAFPLFVENCGFREDNIPQLEDVSNFLKDCTGFILRPIAGQLSARDFLSGLAFRVFQCTQYVRHSSNPLHSDEPDVCHELIGHVPLLADPVFAQFSHEIGLASLGAPDEFIEKLAMCFMYTVEYGLCRQDGQLKACGAELLTSFEELQYSLTDKPGLEEFEPEVTGEKEYPNEKEYQPMYFVIDSFESAKEKIVKFAQTIPRDFSIRYDPYTQCIDMLDSRKQVKDLLKGMRREMELLLGTMDKL